MLALAESDPRGLLATHPHGAIIDEAQRDPSSSRTCRSASTRKALPGRGSSPARSSSDCDAGLAAWLLGVRDPEQASFHARRGALFETLVVNEFLKQRLNDGQPSNLFFWRDNCP